MLRDEIGYFFRKIFGKTDLDSWKDTWGRIDWGDKDHYNPEKIERQIRSMLKRGANPNTANPKDSRSTPLHLVAKRIRCSSSIAPLLEAGAEVDKKDALGKTPLSYAYLSIPNDDKIRIQMALFSVCSADYVPSEEKTSVHTPKKGNFLALLEAGADINTQDNNGKTLLMHTRPSAAFPKLLLECGADPDKRDNAGKTALMHWANQPPYTTDRSGTVYDATEGIRLLAKNCSDVNTQDNLGNTALTYARFIPENFSLLLDAGVDPNIPNKQGKTIFSQNLSDYVKRILEKHQKNPQQKKTTSHHLDISHEFKKDKANERS